VQTVLIAAHVSQAVLLRPMRTAWSAVKRLRGPGRALMFREAWRAMARIVECPVLYSSIEWPYSIDQSKLDVD